MLAAPAAAKGPKSDLEFVGQAIVPSGTMFSGTRVGGLSSITYDARHGVFYAVSDDTGLFGPVRYYTLRLDPASASRPSRRCGPRTGCRTRRPASIPRDSR